MNRLVLAALIIRAVRARRPFFKSCPSELLALATLGVVITTGFMPQLPFTSMLGVQTMPVHFHPIIALVVFAYIAAAEATKAVFYRKIGSPNYSGIARRNI